MENQSRITNFLLLIISVISILFNRSFLMNPFILICLYFSFVRGIKTYFINSLAMIVSALLFSINYSFEIGIIVITYLFSTCLFSLLIRKPNSKYFSLITMNFLFLITVILFDFSLENIILCMINVGLQFITIKSLESFELSINNSNHFMTPIEAAIVLTFIAALGTFFDPIGLISIRLVLLFVALKLKNESGILAIFISSIYCAIFLQYSFITLAILFVPILIVFFIEKFEIPVYLLSSICLMLFSPTPIYLNISFYITIAIALLFISDKNNKMSKIADYFKNPTTKVDISDYRYLVYSNGQIAALNKYLSLVNTIDEDVLSNPLDLALNNIKNDVCINCEHFEHCKLKNNIDKLFKKKLTNADKKSITQNCISPYKLTMAIDTNFKIFQSEQTYFIKCQEANERYRYLIRSIEKPLKLCEKRYEKKVDNIVQQRILDSNLHYYQFWLNNKNIEVVFSVDTFEKDEKEFSDFVANYLENSYVKTVHNQNILTSTIHVTYELVPLTHYDIGVVSKSVDEIYNGDNYFIKELNESLYIMLCDGMGHGETASASSKFLITVAEPHIEFQTQFTDMMNDLNNVLLLKNSRDNYSTMDFCKINLSSLRAKFVKAGAFTTYLIRDRDIIKVEKHNLPLGIVSDCNFDTSDIQLKKGDIVVMLSDGIGERIEEDERVLLINPTASMDLLARNIFNVLNDKRAFTDDSTIITIKLL